MASILKVDKLDPQSGTALEIGTSGDTITVPSGATLDISSATLTPPATLPASSGVNLTALNATNLGSGTVPTARLGTGTASSSTVLYGDQTYKAEPGGGILLQTVYSVQNTQFNTTDTSGYQASGVISPSITPAATGNDILIFFSGNFRKSVAANNYFVTCYRIISGGATTQLRGGRGFITSDGQASYSHNMEQGFQFLDTAHGTTSAITYEIYMYNEIAGTCYLNYDPNCAACFTLMELSQ